LEFSEDFGVIRKFLSSPKIFELSENFWVEGKWMNLRNKQTNQIGEGKWMD
jgi:hypothetical protein